MPSTQNTSQKKQPDRHATLLKHANELGKTSLLESKTNRRKQWTPEKRRLQSVIINDNKPWRKSTGAKTAQGKQASAQNALQHGRYSAAFKELQALFQEMEGYRRLIHAQTWENIRYLRQIHATNRAMTQPTLIATTKEIHALLMSQGMSVPYSEVKMMVKTATGLSETDYITAPDTVITGAQAQALDQIITRRVKGEPLSRIMGEREFWGLPFKVTPDVLDPRPDTETLVEAVLSKVGDKNENIKLLDLGTGTGCIPISLLKELPNVMAYAVDYSYEAAKVARENAIQNGVLERFHIIQGDWMSALKPRSFDMITSNPPYIIESDIENLMPEVKNHDPIIALSGGKDGLDDYKKIIFHLKTHLKKGASAFFEIGCGQLNDLTRLVDESNLWLCDSVADIAGIPRVVEIRHKDLNGDN